MTVSHATSPQPSAHVARISSEAREAPGPDHDGDADDVARAPAPKAALPNGVGGRVDKSA